MSRLFCFGLGYSAPRLWRGACGTGLAASPAPRATPPISSDCVAKAYEVASFAGEAGNAELVRLLSGATHLLHSIPPGTDGDPVLRHYRDTIAALPSLAWIGYLSTVGVYGDHAGAVVDETATLNRAATAPRRAWSPRAAGSRSARRSVCPVQIFRLAGIYGPGRSALDKLRDGTARRVVKPGQVFSRIHVDDIASVLEASIARPRAGAIYNVADDEPAAPDEVIAYAAGLMDIAPPPAVPFEEADLSPMARSFYGDSRRISNARIKSELGVTLRYPTYREGLRADRLG